jgi:hypothetical protein
MPATPCRPVRASRRHKYNSEQYREHISCSLFSFSLLPKRNKPMWGQPPRLSDERSEARGKCMACDTRVSAFSSSALRCTLLRYVSAHYLRYAAQTKGSAERSLKTGKWPLATGNCLSVLRHLRIHTLRPSGNPAGKIVNFAKSRLLQERDRLGAASAHFAVDDDFAAGV